MCVCVYVRACVRARVCVCVWGGGGELGHLKNAYSLYSTVETYASIILGSVK